MDILKIPFVELLSINRDGSTLKIEPKKSLENHLGSIHAGVSYTLAESASGLYLQEMFKELVNSAVPILRGSKVKYKKEIKGVVEARAKVKLDDIDRFLDSYSKKARATISVNVELLDSDNIVYLVAKFDWFIIKR